MAYAAAGAMLESQKGGVEVRLGVKRSGDQVEKPMVEPLACFDQVGSPRTGRKCWWWIAFSAVVTIMLASCQGGIANEPSTLHPGASEATTGHATASVQSLPAVILPTKKPTQSQVPSPVVTSTHTQAPNPVTPSPSATPTLGLLTTRTPAPPAVCPRTNQRAVADLSAVPGPSIVEDLKPQILEYLNSGGSAAGLLNALSQIRYVEAGHEYKGQASVRSVDVTGDTTLDIVADLVFSYPEVEALFVFQCVQGAYHDIYAEFIGGLQSMSPGREDGFREIVDMNGDGVRDIVFSYVSSTSARGYQNREFQIIEWDGTEFIGLIPSDEHSMSTPSSIAYSFDGDGYITDSDEDGTPELAITQGTVPEYPDSGPQRRRTDFWEWDGYKIAFARWQYDPPTYRFQAVRDGDDATRFGEYEKALTFYQQAIFDVDLLGWSRGQFWPDDWYRREMMGGPSPTPTPDPVERPRLEAYARYRIMLLHIIQGHLPEATTVYNTLREKFPDGKVGHSYAELAEVFWQAYSENEDIDAACQSATDFASAHAEDILVRLGSDFYGWANRNYAAQDICLPSG
jgi:hypothetical protein